MAELKTTHWSHKYTKLQIKAPNKTKTQEIIEKALETQIKIEKHVKQNPEFLRSLKPLEKDERNHIGPIKKMLRASNKTGVGPFAAVAGTINQISAGNINEPVLIDNGGDIHLQGPHTYHIKINAGKASLSNQIALEIKRDKRPLGVCTSAGTVGNSLSMGEADAVTVIDRDTALADAAATAIANKVKHQDTETAIKKGLDHADDLEIQGCIIIKDDQIGTTGRIPQINLIKKLNKKKDV